jgi:hypothetical protein
MLEAQGGAPLGRVLEMPMDMMCCDVPVFFPLRSSFSLLLLFITLIQYQL